MKPDPGIYGYNAPAPSCEQLAKKINKQFNGSAYKLITEPSSFVEPYQKRITEALNSTDPEECSLACSGRYNLDEIDKPKMENGKLVFYVHRNSKEFPTPCRITCDNPTSINGKITQECLPFTK